MTQQNSRVVIAIMALVLSMSLTTSLSDDNWKCRLQIVQYILSNIYNIGIT